MFKKIELTDQSRFNYYFSKYQPSASEYTFTNLFLWADYKKHSSSIIDDHLVIKQGEDTYLQPFGKDPKAIIKRILENDKTAKVIRVEENFASINDTNKTIIEDKDQHDYVYLTKELAELKGSKYVSKRNFISQCQKLNPKTKEISQENLKEVRELLKEWCRQKKCQENELMYAELKTVLKATDCFKELNLFGIGIYIQEKLHAIAIGEKLNDKTFVEHFEKADTSFPGIYQYLLWKLCNSIKANYKFINREQDLGVVGIRKSKKSYRPVKMVKKYTIENL